MSASKVRYYAGGLEYHGQGEWAIPDPVHEFSTLEALQGHYDSAKDIAWGGNYYIFEINGDYLTVRIDEISSSQELRELYNLSKKDPRYSKYKDRFPMWTAPKSYP